MSALDTRERTFSGRRRWLQRLNVAASVFLAFYVAAVLNIIIFRHPERLDFTEEGLYSLSAETKSKLGLVNEEIRVIVPYHRQPGNPIHEAHVGVLGRAVALLKEYSAEQPLVRLVEQVDIYAEADRWQRIAKEYGLAATEYNRLIFVAGEGNSLRQAVTPAELAAFDRGTEPTTAPRVKEFRGESAMTSAIMKLVHRTRRKVYFTGEHGEVPVHEALRGDLESSGFEVAEMSFTRMRRVPEDCELLVVAGPERRFSPQEIDVFERYLLEDGRLLVTLGARRTGIEDLLEKWGTRVEDVPIGMRILLPGQRLDRSWVSINEANPSHPITRPFRSAARFDMRLWLPRPLEIVAGTGRRTRGLLETAPSESERFYRVGMRVSDTDPHEGGRFVVATATTPGAPSRPPPGFVRRETRVVVVGASNFLRGGDETSGTRGDYSAASHRDFFMSCVYWLSGEDRLVASRGQTSLVRQLPRFDPPMYRLLLLSSVVVFPGVFALAGIAVYFLRRS